VLATGVWSLKESIKQLSFRVRQCYPSGGDNGSYRPSLEIAELRENEAATESAQDLVLRQKPRIKFALSQSTYETSPSDRECC
jgi:hypothetical protein